MTQPDELPPDRIWVGNENKDLRFRHDAETEKYLGPATEYIRATPRIDDQVVPVALEYFKPPFKYEPLRQTIYCEGANGKQMCLQVRGWGNLIGGGANALPVEKAEHVQDEFGQWVTDALNYYITAHYNLTRKGEE